MFRRNKDPIESNPTTVFVWDFLKAALKFWAFWTLVCLLGAGIIIFVAWHFIAKYW